METITLVQQRRVIYSSDFFPNSFYGKSSAVAMIVVSLESQTVCSITYTFCQMFEIYFRCLMEWSRHLQIAFPALTTPIFPSTRDAGELFSFRSCYTRFVHNCVLKNFICKRVSIKNLYIIFFFFEKKEKKTFEVKTYCLLGTFENGLWNASRKEGKRNSKWTWSPLAMVVTSPFYSRSASGCA